MQLTTTILDFVINCNKLENNNNNNNNNSNNSDRDVLDNNIHKKKRVYKLPNGVSSRWRDFKNYIDSE